MLSGVPPQKSPPPIAHAGRVVDDDVDAAELALDLSMAERHSSSFVTSSFTAMALRAEGPDLVGGLLDGAEGVGGRVLAAGADDDVGAGLSQLRSRCPCRCHASCR